MYLQKLWNFEARPQHELQVLEKWVIKQVDNINF
jgi:hypothetical protein